jgi:hypothetical protein
MLVTVKPIAGAYYNIGGAYTCTHYWGNAEYIDIHVYG